MPREPYTTGYPCAITDCKDTALHDIHIDRQRGHGHFCAVHAKRILRKLHPEGLPTSSPTARPGVWTDDQLDATAVVQRA